MIFDQDGKMLSGFAKWEGNRYIWYYRGSSLGGIFIQTINKHNIPIIENF
jgi:hypothetical protein